MTRFLSVVTAAILVAGAAQAADFEAATMTVSASSILEPGLLKGEYYTVKESVTVEGYMNHYNVDSDFGPFSVTGDWALKKLLHEIDAIAELKKMTSLSTGTDAAVGVVVDTGKSVVNLVTNPVDSAKGMSAGVSRFFKRNVRTAKNVSGEVTETVTESISGDEQSDEEIKADDETVAADDSGEEDDPGLSTQLASSFLGVGKAHRELARELKVDPYSDNAVLQEELNRVAKISGSVGTLTNFLIPIPSVVGTAANIGDMVWSLSPTDLLIQNEEKLKELGYSDDLIQTFFSNWVFSPTMQTALVAALASLDSAKGREVLLNIANAAETRIEGQFIVRSSLFAKIYHETVEPIAELMSQPNGLIPAAITASGDGLIIAPVDQLLWTQELASAMQRMTQLINDHGATDEHLMWVEGRISELALAQLSAAGWVESTVHTDKLNPEATD
jgi:hypothetical protein